VLANGALAIANFVFSLQRFSAIRIPKFFEVYPSWSPCPPPDEFHAEEFEEMKFAFLCH
jgi:hypothetical protein